MATTKKPSGLSITRSRNSFTCTWKQGEKYSKAQEFKRYFKQSTDKKENWVSVDVGTGTTSKTIKPTGDDYFPITDVYLQSVAFKVRGKKKKKSFSSWVSQNGSISIKPPVVPKVSYTQSSYTTSFVVDLDQHVNDKGYWARFVEYQTVFIADNEAESHEDVQGWSNEAEDRKTIYNSITEQDTTSFTITITEPSSNISAITSAIQNGKSAVRWFRVRVSGPGGPSDWVPVSIVYSKPKEAYEVSSTIVDNGRSGYTCSVDWKYLYSLNYPIDTMSIQYAFASPNSDMSPSSPSWQEAVIGGDNTIIPGEKPAHEQEFENRVSFEIDSQAQTDQLVYVRVNTVHNNQTVNSSWALCKDSSDNIPGVDTVLNPPSGLSITPGSNNFISVTVTNNCSVEDSILAIKFIDSDGQYTNDIGIIDTEDQTGEFTKAIEIPPDYEGSYRIGVYAVVPNSTPVSTRHTSGSYGYYTYKIDPKLKSVITSVGGAVPIPPSDLEVRHIGNGNVKVTWNWAWNEADSAEVAWSNYSDALYSTEQPSTYTVNNSGTNRLIIKDLTLGETWYFWIRSVKGSTVSIWSDYKYLSLSSEPSIPVLNLSKNYITLDDKFTADWTYITADNAEQASAKICLCNVDGSTVTYDEGNLLAEISGTTQYVLLDPRSEKLNWSEGESYNLAVKVTSSSGLESESWSDYKTISVIEPTTCSISESSLYPSATDYDPTSTYSAGDYVFKMIDDPDNYTDRLGILYKCKSAISMPEEWNESHWIIDEDYPCQELRVHSADNPLELSIATEGNEIQTVTVMIERSKDYFVDRPDESIFGGFAGESVYQSTNENIESLVINQDEIYNYHFDDGAYYYLILMITDNYGQVATSKYEFKVNWTHQAVDPDILEINATVEDNISKITVAQPTGYETGDVYDIYRLSADGINLVYSNAQFGTTYVDPYPTIGELGGHRIVYRTYNGDYISSDNEPSWVDIGAEQGDIFNSISNLIDFDGYQLEVKYNADYSNSWQKDVQITKYLGGSIQGDYNATVDRTGTLSTDIQTNDYETLDIIRRLAEYKASCHVRTKDGSNYIADVEVNEDVPHDPYYDKDGHFTKLGSYSFATTRVDPIELDGITLEEWISGLPEE